MSEAALSLEDLYPEAGNPDPMVHRGRHLTALAGVGTETVEETAPKYPDMSFAFNDGWVMGSGVVAPSQESRQRAVFTALRQGWEDYEGPDAGTALQQFRHLTSHTLATRVKTRFGDISRGELLSLDDEVNTILDEYYEQNHPVAQLISQFTLRYPELPKGIARELEKRLVVATAHDRIRKDYEAAVKAAKEELAATQ